MKKTSERKYLKPSHWWRVLHQNIIAFAKDSQRKPDEYSLPVWRRYGLEIGFTAAIFIFFITTFAPTIAFQLNRWFTKAPVISFTESRWHVLPEQGPSCDVIAGKECYAHYENSNIWKSSHRLSDKDHQELVEPLQGKKFWVGLEITPSEAKQAFEKRAGMFEIGVLNAAYRVFLNGTLAGEGSGREYIPAELQIPLNILETGQPIRVAIEINHNQGSRLPAWFGAKDMSGLFDYDTATAYRGYWIFLLGFRLLAFSAWSFLLAITFISLWISSPRKAEYLYFGLFLFTIFLTQLMSFGPIKWGTERTLWYASDFFIRVCEGCFGCLLGASFARANRSYLGFAVLISATVLGFGYINSDNHIDLLQLSGSLAKIYVPAMIIIGSFFCFAQAILLHHEKPKLMNRMARDTRIYRLIGFSLLLAVTALSYHLQSFGLLSTQTLTLWHRPIQMSLLALLGIYIFADYKERERVFDITQRSPFHDPLGGIAKPVYGFLVALDLKKSSVLTEYAAKKGMNVRATTLWNALIGRLMMKAHGFKVSDEGDGLKVFFEGEKSPKLFNEIFACLIEAEEKTKTLEAELLSEGLIPKGARLNFRAGLYWGGINPIWKEHLGVKSPEWEDAKGHITFTAVQRIMDHEKTLIKNTVDNSILLTPSDYTEMKSADSILEMSTQIKDLGKVKLNVCLLSKVTTKVVAA